METRHSECRTGKTKITYSYARVKISSRGLESFGLGNAGVKSGRRKIFLAFAQNMGHVYRMQTGWFFLGFLQNIFLKERGKKKQARSYAFGSTIPQIVCH